MNTAELIATVRRNAAIEDTSIDYTDTVLLSELQDSLTTKFQRTVLDARSGYWLQYADFPLSAGTSFVRIPPRAISLSKIEIGTGSGPDINFTRVPRLQEGHTDLFEGAVSSLGRPRFWVARADKLVLIPSSDNGAYTLRVWFYARPSKLVSPQSTATTDRGRVLAVNTSARTITVNTIPWDMSTSASIVSGVTLIDAVRPNGWHELALMDAPQTWSGSVVTVGGSTDLSVIQVGDYIRAADQSDWPPLPDDFHRCVADITTVKVLIQMDFQQKAMGFAADVSSDLERFSALISDRAKEEPRKVRADLPFLRRWR